MNRTVGIFISATASAMVMAGGALAADGLSGAAKASTGDLVSRELLFQPEARIAAERPTLARPMKLDFKLDKNQLVAPAFTRKGLVATGAKNMYGLGRHEGDVVKSVVYDPSVDSWFAWSNGMIVEVREDGSLPLVIEDPPGHDFDIRAAAGLAVFRDPDRNEIVLVSLSPDERGVREKRVLHEGVQFFNPRFSPNGDRIVVGVESGRDGRLQVTDVKTGRSEDMGIGYQPTWSPDGQTLYFMDFENDSYNHTGSRMFARNLKKGATTRLFESKSVIVTNPAISPDGKTVAFFDEGAWDLSVAQLPEAEGEVE